MQHHKLAKTKILTVPKSSNVGVYQRIIDISTEIIIWTPTLIMHLLMFFSPLVESFIIFFRQLIRTVVKIIPFVFHFSDLLSRSWSRSRSFLFQNIEDKPCGDKAAYGAAYYTPKNFVTGHFIKFVGNQIYLPRLTTGTKRTKFTRAIRILSDVTSQRNRRALFIGGNAIYK